VHIVRPAKLEELDEVVQLWGRAAGPTRRAGHRPDAERLVAHDLEALLVAELDGAVVGTIIVGWDGWRCHLYRLAVDARVRRRGIGTALVARAIERAHGLCAIRVDAMVDLGNQVGVAFWESEGFEADPSDGRWSLILE
jgi:ribosomal protein S18 acetylase RimI-like enzyme